MLGRDIVFSEGIVAMPWLFWRKQGWWHGPAAWVLGCALAYPGGLLAIPVSQHAGAWAMLPEVMGLLITLAATIGFFVVKRHGWLLAAPLAFSLSFSLFLALIEGWEAQINVTLAVVEVVAGVAAIGLVGASIFFVGRTVWRVNRANRNLTRKLGENIANEGLFRDDGERIVVYAHRGRVALRALTSLTLLALFVAGDLWARTIVPSYVQIILVVCLGILLRFGGLSALLMLIRTLMTSPTLIVSADGIFDNGSMIVTGRGLLRWNETLGAEEFVYSNRGITYRYLDIIVADRSAINRRQPLGKRALAAFANQGQPWGFRIQRPLLDRSPIVLVMDMNRYISTHAPEGSWHKTMTDNLVKRPESDSAAPEAATAPEAQ